MSKVLDATASRRRFLTGTGAVVGATGVSLATGGPLADAASAAGAASVVLHDPRIELPADVAARLRANGARVVVLQDDPVRLWRTEIGQLLQHPQTRLFGVTRWADYLIVRGLAAESRRHPRYEQHHAQSGHFTWLIA
jgi:hypothetical protein